MTLRRAFALVAIAVVLLVGLFSPYWEAAEKTWTLGRYSFVAAPPSPPLRVNLARTGGLRSVGFLSRVGGIAFSGEMRLDASLVGKRLGLEYTRDRPDGTRLSVTIEGASLQQELADWLLIPIAQYADSEYDACVSLFGPETNDDAYDIVYHDAFENTLLGMRLLQADILFLDLNETLEATRALQPVDSRPRRVSPVARDPCTTRQEDSVQSQERRVSLLGVDRCRRTRSSSNRGWPPGVDRRTLLPLLDVEP